MHTKSTAPAHRSTAARLTAAALAAGSLLAGAAALPEAARADAPAPVVEKPLWYQGDTKGAWRYTPETRELCVVVDSGTRTHATVTVARFGSSDAAKVLSVAGGPRFARPDDSRLVCTTLSPYYADTVLMVKTQWYGSGEGYSEKTTAVNSTTG